MRREAIAITLALFLVTIAVFLPAGSVPYIEYDDDDYVTQNAQVQQGLTWDNVKWAFTETAAANWHPLTWLSHMADVSLWGPAPGPAHRVNVILHALNAVLVFWMLRLLTGRFWAAAAAAALWGLHPLRVESVAWIAERKDVLSGLFFLLTIIAYAWYARRETWWKYGVVVVAFGLALLSKSMVVTVPFLLLVLDAWPLKRARREREGAGEGSRRSWGWLILEKVPLLAMAVGVSIATMLAQGHGGAVRTTEFSFAARATNAVVAYARYLLKTIWPVDLAIYYPHPGIWPMATVALCGGVLILLTLLFLWQARRRPYLMVGWLWFLGTLVPVIGLIVQVGTQSMADRYTYIPGIGLCLIIAWLGAELIGDSGSMPLRNLIAAGTGIVLLALSARTIHQIGYWREGTLGVFMHALNVTEDNWLAHNHVGMQVARLGPQYAEQADQHYRAAIQLNPEFSEAYYNRGNLLFRHEQFDAAAAMYHKAIEVNPTMVPAWGNLAQTQIQLGQYQQALESLTRANELAPGHPQLRAALEWIRQQAPATQPGH